MREIAVPGKTVSHQARRVSTRPSASIPPQEGVEGCAPSPRNARLDSSKIANDNRNVAWTLITARA